MYTSPFPRPTVPAGVLGNPMKKIERLFGMKTLGKWSTLNGEDRGLIKLKMSSESITTVRHY